MDATWKERFLDPFIDAMQTLGCTANGGVSFGKNGIGKYYSGERALAAWCFPATKRNPSGPCEILINVIMEGGVQQARFYFNGEKEFRITLATCVAYAKSRLIQAEATIDQIKSGKLVMTENMNVLGNFGRFYGTIDKKVGNESDLAEMRIQVGGFDEENQCYVVAFDRDALVALSALGMDCNAKAKWRLDNAGQTPPHEMTAAQLEAEIAYYDFMIASSVPYRPNGVTRDDFFAENDGYGSRPRLASAMEFMHAKKAAQQCLTVKAASSEQSLRDKSPVPAERRRMKM